MKKLAFIGCGVMGTALATAASQSISPDKIIVSDIQISKAQSLASSLNCAVAKDNREAVQKAQYSVFCVKPQLLKNILLDLREVYSLCKTNQEEKVIISIVAGVDRMTYMKYLNLNLGDISFIRCLPNTACLVGKGYTLVLDDGSYEPFQLEEYSSMLKASGKFECLPSFQFLAGCVLTSAAPAFLAMYANSLADGGVVNGLLRTQALRLALEGMQGMVQLILNDEEKHLEAYKDDICSPAGPTMIGVKTLEDKGFRSAVINAVVDAHAIYDMIGSIN
ncbi:MAG TPA: pyrroline-5-carboxylate reductase dimerization domain-containing protein [Atopostipes sp.]|nr:pyrroline-5-carboxylate reductase dimerization domain-containing protein [Atopostipes sp.]